MAKLLETKSRGDAIDYFHARRSTLTRISLFGLSFRERQWVTCMENDTELRIPLVEETKNGMGNFQREVVIAPDHRRAAPFHVEEDAAREDPSRVLCSYYNTWTVLSNPFVPDPRLSIFHLTFLSPWISFHHPEPELTALLILRDGITSILFCSWGL